MWGAWLGACGGGGGEAEEILNCGGRASHWASVTVQEASRTLNTRRTSLRLREMTKPDPAMPLDDDSFFFSFYFFFFFFPKPPAATRQSRRSSKASPVAGLIYIKRGRIEARQLCLMRLGSCLAHSARRLCRDSGSGNVVGGLELKWSG